MKLHSLVAVFRALNEAGVRYLVAGGVAVNVHGYQRLTQDLDLVLDLERENVLEALTALEGLGYRPILPIQADDFADPAKRAEWVETRNLRVLSLTSDAHRGTTVDFFAEMPFPFDEEYDRAPIVELIEGVRVPFVDLSTLIEMKEKAGRPRDRDDAEHLRSIREDLDGGPSGVRERGTWYAGTWEGSRREQLRRSFPLSARERIEALIDLVETSERLAAPRSD